MAINIFWSLRETRSMRLVSIESALSGVVTLVFCSCLTAAAQGAVDLTGMWIVQDPGSGNWSEWFDNVPKPALRPEIIKNNEAIAAREAAGAVVNRAERLASCPFGNLPMMMASSPPLNIVQSKDEILIGAEANRGRFIYTDGRRHPDTRNAEYVPSGFGHSVGHWEGDTLVVESIGYRDDQWLDAAGSPLTNAAKVTERFHRLNFGHMQVQITVDDARSFTHPWTVTVDLAAVLDTELLDSACWENEKDVEHLRNAK